MDFEIVDEYGYDEDYSYLDEVIKEGLKEENVTNAVFSIVFVDERRIQEINKEYRHIDRVTDVISFAFEESYKIVNKEIRPLGEIFICIPRMREQAESYGHSEKRELSFLTIHGLLHLLGYDHMNEDDERIMFDKQELILNAAGIKR